MSDFSQAAREATLALRDLFPATPLGRNDFLSEKFGADIWLKREDLTPVRSYKLRGAVNAMRKALDGGEPPVFVCASAGNHAQGVAFACRHFGVRGVIFMPVTTPQQKIHKTRTFGGEMIEIVMTGDYFDDTLAAARADGTAGRLEAAGVQVVPDICWCSISEPVFPPSTKVLMTNSGKYAHYAPGLSGRAVRFGSIADCVDAAVTGQAGEALPKWLAEEETNDA